MKDKSRIIIFGASNGGINAYTYLKNKYQMIAFADNDKNKHGEKLLGYPILSADALQTEDFDKVVIASSFGLQIHRQLLKDKRIPVEKVVRLPNSYLKKIHPFYYLSFFMVATLSLTIITCTSLAILLRWL